MTCHRFPEAKLAEPCPFSGVGRTVRFDSMKVAGPLKSGSASFELKSGDKSPQSTVQFFGCSFGIFGQLVA